MTAGTKGSWSGGGESDGELLVGTADRLRWRAPELALVFARHAATRADAAQDRALALRANALVVAALVRLGKHAEAVEPAVLTLREAESSGARELAGSVRVDLAASTRAIGLAGSAFVLVRPMLEGSDARPSVRAGALAEIVAGLAQAGRREVIDEVLSEADRLYAADENLGTDVRRVLRALLCARIASFRRRWGNPTGAVAAATEGMTLLDGLTEPATDSGQARAELGLEMVSALLDAGEDAAALGQADQTLIYPVRATSAAAIGRLMLVLATRVHFPSGRPKEAHAMLAEIVRVARRHELDGLLADVLTSLAHAQEADGDLTDALDSLRSARAAEQRRLRADTMARLIVLEELGAGTRLPDDTEALLRRVVRTPARSLPDTSGREHASREAAGREMSGRELGGEDIGSQDILARELTGWEMVARERAAMEAGSSRALSDLIDADHAAPEWPAPDKTAHARTESGWSSSDQTSSDWTDSEHAGSGRTGSDWMGSEHAGSEQASSDWAGSERAGSERTGSDWMGSERAGSEQASSDWSAGAGIAAAASSGGGRRRAPVEWSAADRVAADRAVSELASADADENGASSGGSQPKWPDQGVAEERDEETGLLNRQGLRRRLAAARRQSRPTALTLVRLEPTEPDPEPEPHNPDPDSTDRFSAALIKAIDRAGRVPEFDPDVLSSLADHVRDMAPDDAELVRPEEGELAVLMPGTTRDEAEQFAATLRETVSTSDWDPEDPARGVSVSTGVAQYEGTSEDALLTAAREDLTSTDSDAAPDWQAVEPVYDLPPEDSGYTYMQEYAQLSHDGPEPVDPEMAEYLAGFSLPEYGQWSHTEVQNWSHTEEPDMPPRHDTADRTNNDDEDTAAGRSVLDRLDITRGSGGRRRAPDSFAADQSADYAQYPPPSDSPHPSDNSPYPSDPSPDNTQNPSGDDSPYPSDKATYLPDRSSGHAEKPPGESPYPPGQAVGHVRNRRDRSSDYVHYPPDQSPDYGGTGDEILAAAEEAAVRAALPPVELPPTPASDSSSSQSSSPYSPASHSSSSGPRAEISPAPASYSSASHSSALHAGAPHTSASHTSAPHASIPQVPEPEEVPVPPDAPDIPAVPDPDIDPQPGRRRYPKDPDQDPDSTPGRRAIPKNPDIDPPPDDPSYPTDPTPDRHAFPTDPTVDRHGFPLDPVPDRQGFPTDPDPDRYGFPADPSSDQRGFRTDSDRDRPGFPPDPGLDHLPPDLDREPGARRRGFPMSADVESQRERPGFPADLDPGMRPERQGAVAEEPRGGRRRAPDDAATGSRGPAEQAEHRRRGWPESAGSPSAQGPDGEPQAGRRRFPDELVNGESAAVEQRAGRRRMPDQDEPLDVPGSSAEQGRRRMPEQVDAGPEQGSRRIGQAGRRRRIADYLESVERPDPEASPARRRSADQADPAAAGRDSGDSPPAGRRRAPEPAHRPSPQPRPEPAPEPKPQPGPEPKPLPRPEPKAQPAPEPKPDTPQDPEEPRRRRWASILDGQERPGLPPEPAEPRDPPVADENRNPGKPSRNRRREKTDVKLADLLAEALVAYQASTSENPDEDVLSAYDNAAGQVVDDNPRRERETGY